MKLLVIALISLLIVTIVTHSFALFLLMFQDDYRQAVIELDEKEFTSLRLCCCELRNHYVRTILFST